MKSSKSWTTKDIKFIQDNHDKMTVKTASAHLNRDSESVRHQAYRMGYKFKQEWEVQDYAFYHEDKLIGLGKVHEIAELACIKVENLLKYRYECYQKRSKKILIAI